jgi:hypothetical protein
MLSEEQLKAWKVREEAYFNHRTELNKTNREKIIARIENAAAIVALVLLLAMGVFSWAIINDIKDEVKQQCVQKRK